MREIHAVEVVPFFVGLLVERGAPAAEVADVVDENVDPTEVVPRGDHQRVGRVRLPHVADDADDPIARRDLRRARPVGIDLGEHDRRAFRREPLDDPAARFRRPRR